MPQPKIPPVVTFSPTSYDALLRCSRKWRYYTVDKLESRFTAATLAYGRAVHKAIEYALGRIKTPPNAEDVADIFERHFRALDERGIIYRDGDELEDKKTIKKSKAKKPKPDKVIIVPGLVTQGRVLVGLWWETFGDEFARANITGIEKDLSFDIAPGLRVHARIDVAWELDDVFYLTNFKTAKAWGADRDALMGADPQLTIEAYLCWRVLGRIPDVITNDVLKKTKTPQVFRRPTTRSRADLELIEAQLIKGAKLARYYKEEAIDLPSYQTSCDYLCNYRPLCQGVEGAEEFYKTRGERVKETEDEIEMD